MTGSLTVSRRAGANCFTPAANTAAGNPYAHNTGRDPSAGTPPTFASNGPAPRSITRPRATARSP